MKDEPEPITDEQFDALLNTARIQIEADTDTAEQFGELMRRYTTRHNNPTGETP